MTARSNPARLAVWAVLAILMSLGSSPRLSAQEAPEKEAVERPELPPLTATVSPEEALAAIKRRAKKILEAKHRARRLKFSGEISQAVAYETNPSNSSSHTGDTSEETSTYLTLSKKLTIDQELRVILLVSGPADREEHASWSRLSAEQFLAGYSEMDAVYDEA